MKRLGKSFQPFSAASFLILFLLGFTGPAFGQSEPKFVYVTTTGTQGGQSYETFQVTATAVCTSVSCASPISMTGTFTLDVTYALVIAGSISLSDPADFKSSPLVLPFNIEEPFQYTPNNVVLLFGPSTPGTPSVALVFPFPAPPLPESFAPGYSGGPLCSTPLVLGCGASSVAQITTNGGATTATFTSGTVSLTANPATYQGPAGVWGYTIDSTTGALTPIPGSPFAAGLDPTSLAVDPSNRFVYVVNETSNDVSAFAVNSTTGALTPIPGSPFAVGLIPYSVVVDPSDRFVYAANQGSDNVSAFTLDKATGVLTEVKGSPFPAGQGPTFVTMDPLGRFIYVINALPERSESISEYVINTTTGALSPVPGSPIVNGSRDVNTPVIALVDPSGKFLYEYFKYESGAVFSYMIDSSTGALTALGYPDGPLFPSTAAIDPAGNFLYAVNWYDSFIEGYSVDSTTGALVGIPMPYTPTGNSANSLAVDPSGRFVYLVNEGSNNISAYTIDGDTGVLTAMSGSPFATGVGPTSLAIAGSSSTPFEAFKARVDIDEDRKTSFHVDGFFRLAEGSQEIDPVTQPVELQVGTYTVTIPAGSFREKERHEYEEEKGKGKHEFEKDRDRRKREFEFEGTINDVDLHIHIYKIEGRDHLFTAEGKGSILAGIKNPVTVGLTIGENEGSTTVKADIHK